MMFRSITATQHPSTQPLRFASHYAIRGEREELLKYKQLLEDSGIPYRFYLDPRKDYSFKAFVTTEEKDVAEFDKLWQRNEAYRSNTPWEQHVENCKGWIKERIEKIVEATPLDEKIKELTTLLKQPPNLKDFFFAFPSKRAELERDLQKLQDRFSVIKADFEEGPDNFDPSPYDKEEWLALPEWKDFLRQHLGEYEAKTLLQRYEKGALDLKTGITEWSFYGQGA